MREIKTRKQSKGIKSLQKAVSTGDRMKQAFLQTKEKSSQATDNRSKAPNEYAGDKLQAGFDEVGHDAGQLTVSGSRLAIRKGREAIQDRRVKAKDAPEPAQTDNSQGIQPTGANRKR